MSSEPAASVTPSSSSLWDRITSWASENKAIVYTIAGTAVIITGAGAVYYFSDLRTKTIPPAEKKKSKKERRNDKKKAEEQSKSGTSLKDEEAGTRSSVDLMDSSH
jgi:import receptor subunit TOM70